MITRKIDLNLLRVFELVMRHRSVSVAARELSVTPSAISHALARLRHAVGDELLVPGETGMEPTPRALDLAPSISDGLARLASALSAKSFNPRESVRTFRIAATDYPAVAILPAMIGRIATTAPHIDLRVFPLNRMDVVRSLDEGRLDVALGWFGHLPDRMRHAPLLMEQEALVVRAGHPLTLAPVTREALFDFPHVVVELTGTEEQATEGYIDDRGVARRVWIERLIIEAGEGEESISGRVAVSVPHYAAVAPILEQTDMVATLPLRLAAREAARGTLVLLEMPYQPMTVPIWAVWHERVDREPGLRWLVDELAAAADGSAGVA